jgi:hypothetical protein
LPRTTLLVRLQLHRSSTSNRVLLWVHILVVKVCNKSSQRPPKLKTSLFWHGLRMVNIKEWQWVKCGTRLDIILYINSLVCLSRSSGPSQKVDRAWPGTPGLPDFHRSGLPWGVPGQVRHRRPAGSLVPCTGGTGTAVLWFPAQGERGLEEERYAVTSERRRGGGQRREEKKDLD